MLVGHNERVVTDESAIAAALGQSSENVERVGGGRECGAQERSGSIESKELMPRVR
jgi:DNA-binding transcriptional regulator YdaS (Cro superfamily)